MLRGVALALNIKTRAAPTRFPRHSTEISQPGRHRCGWLTAFLRRNEPQQARFVRCRRWYTRAFKAAPRSSIRTPIMSPTNTATRVEKDSLGEISVPATAYYGAQTARAVANYPISGMRTHPALIRAYGLLKLACAEANVELEMIPAKIGRAI